MFERLEKLFSHESTSRFRILYGEGIDDVYLPGNELGQSREKPGLADGFFDFETAFRIELNQQGFDRILFISPHQPIYFNDLRSKQLCLENPQPIGQPDIPAAILGPLGKISLLPGFEPAGNVNHWGGDNVYHPFHGMGDLYAVRMLDHFMRLHDGHSTAVVVMQAESFLEHQDDQRSTVSIIGEWGRTPQTADNLCFFVFSARSYEQLNGQAMLLPLPEIRSKLLNQQQDMDVCEVGCPLRDELDRLLPEMVSASEAAEAPQRDHLLRSILAEGGLLSLWHQRIKKFRFSSTPHYPASWFRRYPIHEKTATERLDELVGLARVKEQIQQNLSLVQVLTSDPEFHPNLHMMFVGNPGTGKTTVARLVGELYFTAGLLRRGHLVEVQAADLIAEHVGGTSIKTNSVVNQALDGVLFVDEAYMLTDTQRGQYGQEALDTLLIRMENERDRLVVIFAGYSDPMQKFRESNSGLARRIPMENVITFDDLNAHEMCQVLKSMLAARGFSVAPSAEEKIQTLLKEMDRQRDETFGNAGEMRNLAEGLIKSWASRQNRKNSGEGDKADPVILENDLPRQYHRYIHQHGLDVIEVDRWFENLVGLANVKHEFYAIKNQIQYGKLRSQITQKPISGFVRPQHLAFLGNPGTGKTTVARLIGRLYYEAGILRKGHCVEVSRVGLVGGYVGQTAIKTMEVVKKALDGVLFIDEAYSLVNGGHQDFGYEALDTLVKAMEDYRERLLVIFAGYSQEMQSFLHLNPGLASRIPSVIYFHDYSAEEMGQILKNLSSEEEFVLPEQVQQLAIDALVQEQSMQKNHFGNARSVRNLYQRMKANLSARIVATDPEVLRSEPELVVLFAAEDVNGVITD